MYTVKFSDLEKMIKIFKEKVPECITFETIHANYYGDLIIRTDPHTFLIKRADFSIWVLLNNNWRNKWIEVK